MASTVNQQQPFPAVPPSLSAGDHEMRDYYATQNAPRPALNQTPYLRPYLGLRARLSQIWINRWTVLLILVLVRLLFAIGTTNSSLASARREALSACTQVENIGSSMASMPHFMAQGVNEMTASGVEKAVGGLMTMLDMSVTGAEEIVLFVIHMMTSTYLCLITLAVRGSLHAAVEIGNQIASDLNKTVDDVTNNMSDSAKSVTDGINSILGKINFPLGPDFQKPQINLDGDISKLKALEVPPQLQQDLVKLNGSIPTFEDVQNFTDTVIRLPFEDVKKLIQEMKTFQFNRSLLPVPQKEQLDFCSQNNSINDFFDELLKLAFDARNIAIGVLIALAILVCVPMAWMETRRYRKIEQRVQEFEKGRDPMDVGYLISRPTSSTIGLWVGRRFGSTRRQAISRWTWSYATSVPMLLLLALGLAGLFSCFCQYLLLKSIQREVPKLTNEVADFAEKVVNSLNNASESWSNGVNDAVAKLNTDINQDLLTWTNTSITAVNNTLNTFVDKMSTSLNDTFGGTVLYDPIKDVLNCLIDLKIAGFQNGLTWVQDNAHVSFPGVKDDTFSLGALAQVSGSSSAAQLLANPNDKAQDEITAAVGHVINTLEKGIFQETLISLTIVLIWLFIAFGGFMYALTHLARRNSHDDVGTTAFVTDPATRAYPPDAAPPYEYPVNKAAPYTLQSRPFPTYAPNDPNAETVRHVDAHAVGEPSRPRHLRTSSHGLLAEPSPMDEKRNPFADPHQEKRDPSMH